MQKKPNDYRQIIFLTVIFLIGLAMIFIPLVQQHQEIDADNNIYAMLAEEIKNQQTGMSVLSAHIGLSDTQQKHCDLRPSSEQQYSYVQHPDELQKRGLLALSSDNPAGHDLWQANLSDFCCDKSHSL